MLLLLASGIPQAVQDSPAHLLKHYWHRFQISVHKK